MSQKRVFLIHCWDGTPEYCWYPWVKSELEKRGYEVFVPAMPNTEAPEIGSWVGHLKEIVGKPDEQTYFVGHSIGGQTILRYLQTLDNKKVGGAVFVAGWFTLFGLEDEEAEAVAKPWLETPIDFAKVKNVAPNITVILSDDDPYVPFEENKKLFEEKLGARVVVEHGKGHFDDFENMKELPSALDSLLSL